MTRDSQRLPLLAPLWLALVVGGAALGARVFSTTVMPKVGTMGLTLRLDSMSDALSDPAYDIPAGSVALVGSSPVAAGWDAPEIEKDLRARGVDRRVYNFGMLNADIRHLIATARVLREHFGSSSKRFGLAVIEVQDQDLYSSGPEDAAMAFRIALWGSRCGHLADTVPPLPWLDRATGYDRMHLLAFTCLLGGIPPEENVRRFRSQIQIWTLPPAKRAEMLERAAANAWREDLAGTMAPPSDPAAYTRRVKQIAGQLPEAASDMKARQPELEPYPRDELDRTVLLAREWKALAENVIVVRPPRHPLFKLPSVPAPNIEAWRYLTAELAKEQVAVVTLDPDGQFVADDFFDETHFERTHGVKKAAVRLAEVIGARLGAH